MRLQFQIPKYDDEGKEAKYVHTGYGPFNEWQPPEQNRIEEDGQAEDGRRYEASLPRCCGEIQIV